MFENLQVELKAVKTILKDCEVDTVIHESLIETYDEARETLVLVMDSEEVKNYYLDNVYQCAIKTESGDIYCYGIIRERFLQNDRGVVKFSIQNGFYRSIKV